MKFLTFCLLTTCHLLLATNSNAQLTKYVNPFIGTGGTGHTFPGATTPFAMVQLSPDTRIDGSWEGCSGYHYNDSIIYGFSHTHLSGTGCSDYGDIAFMPYFSKTENFDYVKSNLLQAKFSHKNEKASAGYYSVVLDDIPVKVELSATTRTGFQRYTFNEEGYGYIVLNLKHRDELIQGKIQKSKAQTYKGIRVSKAWAKRQELYYGFELDFRFIGLDALPVGDPYAKQEIVKDGNNDMKLIIQFKALKGLSVQIKTGISTVDEDAALNNLKVENPSWDFEKIKQQAQQNWEKELKKIEVQDAKQTNKTKELTDKLTTFYTAMYHCMIHPSIMNDVDGRYKGRDGKIHKAEGFNYYTVFSLWDTHRALHPLLNIIDKKRSHDFVITFLKQYEQSGRLPMWELWSNETDCMIGFHSVSVILDAYRKQVISKDELQQLWPAVKAEAMSNRFGLDKFREKGYLSVEDESESVSKTLEYSYDMWCVSEIAGELGLGRDCGFLGNLQNAWNDLQNPDNRFMQPRKNGNWLQNFNPFEVNNNYTEANAWQYSFYHPHYEIKDYNLLYQLFKASPKTEGRQQADITGLIGQYAHGNEPSHNYIYLLGYAKRKEYLKYVLDNFYTNKPDGLIGNEDCGQMSAWYVMSALGFYQTCPGNNNFNLGYPVFDGTIVTLENSHKVEFKKRIDESKKIKNYRFISDNLTTYPYVYRRNSIISCEQLFKAKSNIFETHSYDPIPNEVNSCAGVDPIIISDYFARAPLIIPQNTTSIFNDSVLIKIVSPNHFEADPLKSEYTYYKVDNDTFKKYVNPFYLTHSAKIEAEVRFENFESHLSIAHFYKRPHNYSIQLNCKYNRQYTADGDDGIIDGQYGDIDWRKGGWQGYQSQNFEAIIDMKEKKEFAEISANFLQDTRAWILFPTKVEFYTSDDNINYKLAEVDSNYIPANDYKVQTQKFVSFYEDRSLKILPPTQKREVWRSARYIKIKAYNYGKLPEWHAGKGDDAFIFIDEIEIK